MNILHINTSKTWRGAEQQIWYLLQADAPGISNFLFCPQGAALHKRALSLHKQTGTYVKRFGWDMVGAWKLKAFIKATKINLVHIHDSHALNLYQAARILGLRIPAVLTRHVCFKPGNPYKYRGDAIKRIICVSGSVKETMASIAEPEKCVVIHPGIAFPETSRQNNLRRILGLGDRAPLVGTVCALEAEKDLPAFLRIGHLVLKDLPGVNFVIIGDGSLREAIITQAASLGLTERLQLTGFRNDVPQLLPDLDLFLFTSASEGFSLALAESLLAGVPVVARQIAGIQDLIRDGISGRLYGSDTEAANTIRDILQDEDIRLRLVRQGREHAKQFSVERLIEKTHNLYREINI